MRRSKRRRTEAAAYLSSSDTGSDDLRGNDWRVYIRVSGSGVSVSDYGVWMRGEDTVGDVLNEWAAARWAGRRLRQVP